MATGAEILTAIKSTYDQLDTNFDALYSKCTTDAERQQLKGLLVSTRDAFFAAAAKALTDDNPTVNTLTKDLQTTNANLSNQLTDIKDIVNVLALCTEALKLGASLAVLAAVA